VALRAGQHRALLAFAGTASALDQVTGSPKPFDGWVATGWKKKVPATAVTASKSGTSFRFITVFATGDGTDPTVSSMPVEGAVFSLEVATGQVTEQMIVHAAPRMARPARIAACPTVCWGRRLVRTG